MTNDSAGMATQPWEDADAPHGAQVFHAVGPTALPCPKCDVRNHILMRVVGVSDWQCAACHNRDAAVLRYRKVAQVGRRALFSPGSKAPDPDLTADPIMPTMGPNPAAIGDLLTAVLGAEPIEDADR